MEGRRRQLRPRGILRRVERHSRRSEMPPWLPASLHSSNTRSRSARQPPLGGTLGKALVDREHVRRRGWQDHQAQAAAQVSHGGLRQAPVRGGRGLWGLWGRGQLLTRRLPQPKPSSPRSIRRQRQQQQQQQEQHPQQTQQTAASASLRQLLHPRPSTPPGAFHQETLLRELPATSRPARRQAPRRLQLLPPARAEGGGGDGGRGPIRGERGLRGRG